MPRFDGTGPIGNGLVGHGAMTGRGLGYCTGVKRPMYGGFIGRRGSGFGLGRGNGGYARPFYTEPAYNEKPSKELLKDQKKYLEEELEAINKQLEQIK